MKNTVNTEQRNRLVCEYLSAMRRYYESEEKYHTFCLLFASLLSGIVISLALISFWIAGESAQYLHNSFAELCIFIICTETPPSMLALFCADRIADAKARADFYLARANAIEWRLSKK